MTPFFVCPFRAGARTQGNAPKKVISALRSLSKSSHTTVCCGFESFASLEIPLFIHVQFFFGGGRDSQAFCLRKFRKKEKNAIFVAHNNKNTHIQLWK